MTEPTVRFTRTPVDGPITQEFGDMYSGYPHRGVDFGVRVGTTVYAPAAGKVVTPYNDGSFGIAVCLEHDGWYTLYAHLSRSNVSNGDTVRAEQIIGYSGNTGYSTGPHLHWQLSDSPSFPIDVSHSRDPMKYIHKEDDMTPEEREMLYELTRAMTGFGETPDAMKVLKGWNYSASGDFSYNSMIDGYTLEQQKLGEHLANHPSGGTAAKHTPPTGIPKHQHDVAAATTGDPR